MPLILSNSAFLHIPKTGGTWVRRLALDMGLVKTLLLYGDPALSAERVAPSHHSIIRAEDRPAVVFAFVRHPLTWYRSYWAWKSRMFAWNPCNPLDRTCASADFNEFVGRVLRNFPDGYLNRLYPFFLNCCTHVGKFESLRTDLAKLLEIADEPYDAERVRSFPPSLSSFAHSDPIRYPLPLASRIMQAEAQIAEVFGYQLVDELLK